ncbi:MAG: GNAT family N-acetyltransferase [Candidatus Eremiobacteraeota bacterium]|nr:GNAT family N-acetyltransferase [Candidatus Eremiobacteraeota bacterium]
MQLRAYLPADKGAMVRLFGDPLVMRFASTGAPLKRRHAELLFDKIFEVYRSDPQFHVWAVEENGAYVGHAELKRRSGRAEYELVYFLAREVWRHGLGGRVVDRLLEEARAYELPFVIATVDERNAASLAILRRRLFVFDERLTKELDAPAYRRDL